MVRAREMKRNPTKAFRERYRDADQDAGGKFRSLGSALERAISLILLSRSIKKIADLLVGGLREVFIPLADPVKWLGCCGADDLIDLLLKFLTS